MGGMSDFPYNFKPQTAQPAPAPNIQPPPPELRPATRGDIAAVIAELKAIRELLQDLAAKR